jgi:hypothetical protein
MSCQCFVPVDEFPARDAGLSVPKKDAGLVDSSVPDSGIEFFADAGFDAGARDSGIADAGFECVTSGQCPTTPTPYCTNTFASCLDGRCVQGCAESLTCTKDQEPCFQCAVGRRCADCGRLRGCQMEVSGNLGSCSGILSRGNQMVVQPFSGRCGGALLFDGGIVGTWVSFDQATSVITFPSLGLTCLGSDLFTGLPRTFVSCPGCSFIAEGCE